MNSKAKSAWLLNIIELPRPVKPGDKIRDDDGKLVRIYEVRKMRMLSSPIAGRARPLYAILHAGAGSIAVAVCVNDDGSNARQNEWCSK